MAKSKVPVTFAFGRRDRVDPRLAPFGVLKIGRNLRVRKDGRLGMRHGYERLDMSTRNADLVAFDLHEYKGRLIALGTDGGDGYPTDLYELTGLANEPWRGTDANEQRVMLSPFSNLRETAGIPQPEAGVTILSAAADGGYVCLVYRPNNAVRLYALIVDAETDQVIHQQEITRGGLLSNGSTRIRVVGVSSRFYIGSVSTTNEIEILRFRVGTDTGFSSFANVVAASGAAVTAFDMAHVSNGTTARLIVAWDKTGLDLTIAAYDTSGGVVGAPITVAGTATVHLAIEADQTDDTINLYTVENATDSVLRTFSFAGALLDGPTTLTSGTSGYLCRLPAMAGFTEHVAVCINTSTSDVRLTVREVDTHTQTEGFTIQRAIIAGRPLSGQSANHPIAVVFPALVGPDLATLKFASNALFFVTPDAAHMAIRDFSEAESAPGAGLTFDADTGKICWPAARDPGVDVAMPVVTQLDFQSTERRQSAKYGGQLYFAGAPVHVYDGRLSTELGFSEVPGIVSATPSNGAGGLANSATYDYVVHWEYVLADGSVEQGPVSAPFRVTTGASDDTVTLVVTAPHSIRLAAGDALFGANVVAVVHRTYWDAVNSIPFSSYQRAVTEGCAIGMVNYGETLTLVDTMSDADLLTQGLVYTQADRGVISGPLEHNAPQACSYIAATEARIILGGLTRECDVQISKAAFLGEPFAFSEREAFFATCPARVAGVQRLDSNKVVFTAEHVLALGGDGPDDLGGLALEPPIEIPTPSGLSNPWSFLYGPDGLWFQLDETKLFRVPRGGGAPTWEGIDVEDTLLAYPVITGAAKHRGDNVAVFACNNVDSTDAVFVVRGFRTEQWFEDTPFLLTDGEGVEAMTSYGETLAYTSGGAVYVQGVTFADGPGLFIACQWRTHPLYPFGVGGYGNIYDLLVTGEVRGDCKLQTRVSYDDGQTFTGLVDFDFDGIAAGSTFQRKFTLPQDVTNSVVIEFVVSSLDGSTATEGLVINQVDLLVEAEDGLRELDPDEMG